MTASKPCPCCGQKVFTSGHVWAVLVALEGSDRPLNYWEFEELLSGPGRSVLARLIDRGLIARERRGVYSITEMGRWLVSHAP